VQEDRLLAAATGLLPGEKNAEMQRLRAAWRARNVEVFEQSMRVLAAHVLAVSTDREEVPERLDPATLAARAKAFLARDPNARRDPAVESAMAALLKRADERLRADTDKLITLHGLAGRAKQQVLERASGQFELAMPADVAGTGIVGGMLTGAAGGLVADLSAGGLTLGAGMLIGAIVGALGAGGAAKAYNVLHGQEDGRVRWSADFVAQRVRGALLLYLAVAHYGRGRGDWVQGEAPPHWPPLVEDVVRTHMPAVDEPLEPALLAMGRDLLLRLYPEARAIFSER
jgi:hypothetical protein